MNRPTIWESIWPTKRWPWSESRAASRRWRPPCLPRIAADCFWSAAGRPARRSAWRSSLGQNFLRIFPRRWSRPASSSRRRRREAASTNRGSSRAAWSLMSAYRRISGAPGRAGRRVGSHRGAGPSARGHGRRLEAALVPARHDPQLPGRDNAPGAGRTGRMSVPGARTTTRNGPGDWLRRPDARVRFFPALFLRVSANGRRGGQVSKDPCPSQGQDVQRIEWEAPHCFAFRCEAAGGPRGTVVRPVPQPRFDGNERKERPAQDVRPRRGGVPVRCRRKEISRLRGRLRLTEPRAQPSGRRGSRDFGRAGPGAGLHADGRQSLCDGACRALGLPGAGRPGNGVLHE